MLVFIFSILVFYQFFVYAHLVIQVTNLQKNLYYRFVFVVVVFSRVNWSGFNLEKTNFLKVGLSLSYVSLPLEVCNEQRYILLRRRSLLSDRNKFLQLIFQPWSLYEIHICIFITFGYRGVFVHVLKRKKRLISLSQIKNFIQEG